MIILKRNRLFGENMTSKERREKGMLFIADEQDWVEMKNVRKLLQTLNNMDRSDFSGINSLVRELFGRADESTFLNPPFFWVLHFAPVFYLKRLSFFSGKRICRTTKSF